MDSDELADIDNERPTVDDVLQRVYDHPAVPVRVADPVQVRQMPSLSAQSRNIIVPLDTAEAVKLLNADPRRSRAVVICTGGPIFIGTDKAATQGKAVFRLAVAQLLTLTSQDPWYVMPDTADATVSVIADQWAE